jgi:hypothetical protein
MLFQRVDLGHRRRITGGHAAGGGRDLIQKTAGRVEPVEPEYVCQACLRHIRRLKHVRRCAVVVAQLFDAGAKIRARMSCGDIWTTTEFGDLEWGVRTEATHQFKVRMQASQHVPAFIKYSCFVIAGVVVWDVIDVVTVNTRRR